MPLPLFLVTFNHHGYDQYDAFVVAATDEDAALTVVRDAHPPDADFRDVDWDRGFTVERIEPAGPEIILASFNAG